MTPLPLLHFDVLWCFLRGSTFYSYLQSTIVVLGLPRRFIRDILVLLLLLLDVLRLRCR